MVLQPPEDGTFSHCGMMLVLFFKLKFNPLFVHFLPLASLTKTSDEPENMANLRGASRVGKHIPSSGVARGGKHNFPRPLLPSLEIGRKSSVGWPVCWVSKKLFFGAELFSSIVCSTKKSGKIDFIIIFQCFGSPPYCKAHLQKPKEESNN